MTAASLTMNAFFNALTHTPTTSWGIRYRLNGGVWRDRLLAAAELPVISAQDADGNIALTLDVPVGDLRSGLTHLNYFR